MDTSATRPTFGRLALLGGLVLVWVVYITMLWRAPGSGGDLTPTDFDWRLVDLDGRETTLGAFRGKPLFLNLWATWCGPCIMEMPSIARLAASPRMKDVAFVLVSDEPIEAVRAYAQSSGLALPFYHAAEPPPPPLASQAIPATFLIAPDGRIVKRQLGATEWDGSATIDLLESLSRGR